MPPARSHAYRWMRLADRRYITARFLFRKGLLEDFALTGAFAFELYLKAFIVQMHRSFSVHHKLTALCDTCRQSDDFFERFVNDPDWEYGWPAYWDMYRYPEPIPGNRTGGKTYIGSHELQQVGRVGTFCAAACRCTSGPERVYRCLWRSHRLAAERAIKHANARVCKRPHRCRRTPDILPGRQLRFSAS